MKLDPKASAYLKGLANFNQSLATGPRNLDQLVNFSVLQRVGSTWGQEVIDSRAIPPGKAKAVEMAVRIFLNRTNRSRPPKDFLKWARKNEKRFQVLADAVHWPERGEDDGQFRLGPFLVHNTLQAKGKQLQRAEGAINRALQALGTVDRIVPGFRKMAQGDLYLVGQIGRKNWGAWYMQGPDTIYIRPNVRGLSEAEIARHLVHELTHRYWKKVLDGDSKRDWKSYHNSLGRSVKVSLPKEGEAVPFPVNGETVTVHYKIKPGKIVFKDESGTSIGMTNPRTLFKWMEDTALQGAYPTAYAAQDPEEHFAEAVSLLAFGDLDAASKKALESLLSGKASAYRVASRYGALQERG